MCWPGSLKRCFRKTGQNRRNLTALFPSVRDIFTFNWFHYTIIIRKKEDRNLKSFMAGVVQRNYLIHNLIFSVKSAAGRRRFLQRFYGGFEGFETLFHASRGNLDKK